MSCVFDSENATFTHMWMFPGTYPTYVTQQKSYFFAVVAMFGTVLTAISGIEAIKGYDPKKQNAAIIATVISFVLLSLFLFSVYILADDRVWTDRYADAVASLGAILGTSSPSIIMEAALFQPSVPLNSTDTLANDPANEWLLLTEDSVTLIAEEDQTQEFIDVRTTMAKQ